MQYYSTLKAKLIYIFTIEDEAHKNCVKIGETTLDDATSPFLNPNSKELNAAARKRIDQYTRTAGITYTLRHTELTLYIRDGQAASFDDKEVHKVLLRSGIKRHDFSSRSQGCEWFECSVETALKAIQAVKEGKSAIGQSEIVPVHEVIEFRPEQKDAIVKTVAKFSSGGKSMLWNAKMRFGKTLCALQVVKELKCHRTIILTHRPVVDKGWFEDFGKIFEHSDGYTYGSRDKGETFENLEKAAQEDPDRHYVYFASMQDMRGAQMAGGKFDKNADIFKADYDMLIIDEAHEGTQTDLGQKVIKLLTKNKTHILNLSGTPFNLLDDYDEDEIFTWDYVMEQRAKADWDINHFGDPNPYADLPRLNIFTFDLGKVVEGFEDVEDMAFNFKEFFRTWTGDKEKDFREMPEGMEGRFVHEAHVEHFLDLMVKYDPKSNYPFSTKEFRENFRHTLWMVPGVKEARALSALLKQHPIFGQFQIVNVAGEGDEDVEYEEALNMVEKAMGENPEDTMTITLSCGRLTTGVTVKPWTAVMMLSGSHSTDAKAYMQTIFRVQSPYTSKDGRRKDDCYVFDFAPDRTLKVLADTAKVSVKTAASESERVRLGEFLNFCPVIGYNGTHMSAFNVDSMMEQLKKAYISRITRNGCDDSRLYNQEMLRTLTKNDLEKFKNLHKIIGSTKANHTSTDVDLAQNGLTKEQYKEIERLKNKPKKELTEEEKVKLAEAKEKKKNADAAISILRGISIRLPLMMYGAELNDEDKDITLDNFTDLIDDQSWEEFMPRGVTKDLFKQFIPFYDPDIFRAVSRSYRDLVREADKLAPMERVKSISAIFNYFRNPDKETVLTPWRVVNMHMGDCIGGQVFYDEDMETLAVKPREVVRGKVTAQVFNDPNTRILEINSKTGLYPLYMTYSVFAVRLQEYRDSHMLATDVPIETQNQIWDQVLCNNIFVICKTEMAKSITRRTLLGFRDGRVNARYFEDLVNKIKNQPQLFLKKVVRGKEYWKNDNIEDDMKFNAIVGNPPYQIALSSTSAYSGSIYQHFIEIARKLYPSYISMITPSRWMTKDGQGIKDEWVDDMINCNHFIKLVDFLDAGECFHGVDIKGGVNYFLYSQEYTGTCEHIIHQRGKEYVKNDYLNSFGAGIIIRDPNAENILEKIFKIEGQYLKNHSFASMIGPRDFYTTKVNGESILGTNWKGYVKEKDSLHNIKFYVNKKMDSSGFGWISQKDILKNRQTIAFHKVFIPNAGGSGNDPFVLGRPFYGEPYSVCSVTYLVIGYNGNIKSQQEAENIISYIETRFFRYLVSIKKRTQHNPRDVFQFVPVQDWSHPWTDERLYKKYELTSDEIKYIESMIKPMEEDKLFDVEPEIDSSYDFNLEEYGVKVGDKIIYTPADIEATVLKDNQLEYEGEKYSVAEFTYKFMPENSISKSGVCKGPKYFSYKGVSLYKLKNSFLGGNK